MRENTGTLLMSRTTRVGPPGNDGASTNAFLPHQPDSSAFERHFSTENIAKLWNLSVDSVRRIFEREPGVLVVGDSNPRGKRRYRTLRIPESVVRRVHQKRLLLVKQ